MSDALEQANFLRKRHRYSDAVSKIMEHLAKHPNDSDAHFSLALTKMQMPGMKSEALDAINSSIGLAPDEGHTHALKSIILSQMDRDRDALESAESAIAFAPASSFSWQAKAQALSGMRKWAEAEQAARHSLVLDPDNDIAQNQLTMFLRLQNRLDEASGASERQLSRDPEDAFAHANAGWSELQSHNQEQAEEYFREALRLDPEMEYARLGLREAYKSRSWFYRMFLRYSFFMQRFTEGKQWLIIIGIYLGFKLGRTVLTAVHPVAGGALVAAYLLFVFWGFLASGLGHFVILKDPLARLTLTFKEKLDGLFVGGGFLLGVLLLILGLTIFPVSIAVIGGALAAGAIPASLTFTNTSRTGKIVFGLVLSAVYLCGLVGAISLLRDPVTAWDGIAGSAIGIGILASIGCTWLSMIPALRSGGEE